MGSSETTSPKTKTPSISEKEALRKEFNKLKNSDQVPVVKGEYVNNDPKHWRVVFKGSDCSPYEDGYFIIEFKFNKGNFPEYGPDCYFITKMFHPNIYENGFVCIKYLSNWDPKRSIESVLLGILEIMDNPIPDHGYSNDATSLLKKNKDEFIKKVEEYTFQYAMKSF